MIGVGAHAILVLLHFYSLGSLSITTIFDGLLICNLIFVLLAVRLQKGNGVNIGYGIILWPVNLVLSLTWSILLQNGTPFPPELRSPYFTMHALFLFGAYVCFFFSFSSSLLYLFQYYHLKYKKRLSSFRLFPSLDAADHSVMRADSIGLGLMIPGIVMGYLWLYMSGGDMRTINLKAGLSILASAVYLSEHILRIGKGWQGLRASFLSIGGFLFILTTIAVGRHGY